MLKLIFYVPKDSLHEVKSAVLSAGGGNFPNYSDCCWYVLGTGEFRPNEGSAPCVGEVGKLSVVEEYRVEVLIDTEALKSCIAALKLAHPYEQPAFEVYKLEAW